VQYKTCEDFTKVDFYLEYVFSEFTVILLKQLFTA